MADEVIDRGAGVTPASMDAGVIDLSSPDAFRKSAGPITSNEPISALESFGRGAVEGATFGFDDKLGFDKDRREASRKANPWTHFAGELVGGIAPIAASGGAGAGLRAGAAAADAAGLTRLARAGTGLASGVEAAFLPGEISGLGSAALQGMKLGSVSGGLSGAGHADVNETDTTGESAKKRAMGALTGSAVGTVLGAPVGVAGHVIGRAAQHTLGARAAANAETADATAGSLMAISRGLERDRITPDQVIQQIVREFPDDTARGGGNRFWGNRQPWTADMVEGVVRRAINGESAADISAAMRANGQGPGQRAVQTLLNELEERHLGPLNLVDRASMVRTGSGTNTQMTMRAAAATPGQAQSVARENLLERQIGSQGRLRNAFERTIGSADFDGVAAKHSSDLQTAGNQAYGAAMAAEQPFSLMPIFNAWDQRYATQRGPVPDGVRQALNDMTTVAQGTPTGHQPFGFPPQSLEGYINARQNLQQHIDSATPRSPLHRALINIKSDMDAEVRQTNPLWGVANDLWRDGKAAEDAMHAGSRQALRLNSASRENLSEYTDATKLIARGTKMIDAAKKAGQPTTDGEAVVRAGRAREDLFRVGLVRSLSDMLANQGETHNLTQVLRLPAARKILETVLGPDDAGRLYSVIDAEHAMHRTYSSQFGSQTTPLREAVDDLNWAPRFTSAWQLLNPKVALATAGEWAASRMNASRNQRMMPLMTETSPTAQLDTLRAVNQVSQARQIGDQTIRRPAIASSGTIADASTAELMPKPKSSQAGSEARYLSQARNALLQGKDRKAVEDKLRELGVDPRKL